MGCGFVICGLKGLPLLVNCCSTNGSMMFSTAPYWLPTKNRTDQCVCVNVMKFF